MITFETQEDFEEAVKAVIRGSLGLDKQRQDILVWLRLELDGEEISGVYLG